MTTLESRTLWKPFSPESGAPKRVDENCLLELEALWSAACQMLAIEPLGDPDSNEPVRFFKLMDSFPCINFSLLISTLTSGGLVAVQTQTGYELEASVRPQKLLANLRLHFRIEPRLEVIMAEVAKEEVNGRDKNRLDRLRTQSLALGIAQEILSLRLPRVGDAKLARWLIDPRRAPLSARRTLGQLLAVQKLRDNISFCWSGFFEMNASEGDESVDSLTDEVLVPEFFWQDALARTHPQATHSASEVLSADLGLQQRWSGVPICGGFAEGDFEYIDILSRSWREAGALNSGAGKKIFVFKSPRIETIEFFDHASGIVFIQGGLLNHTCSVVRERNIPCITQVGQSFFEAIKTHPHSSVRIDCNLSDENSWVSVLERGSLRSGR